VSSFGGLLAVLIFGGSPAQPVDASCAQACYQQKSMAYQRCRDIPPVKRAERNRCFREADRALQRCLQSCR
jgi:hypothetical protein